MRKKNSIRNSFFTTVRYILNILASFIVRTIFIQMLSAEYLGVNGLFSNILHLLSLAELGIGNAINYALYKPLADNDRTRIKQLMAFYKNAYRIMGVVVSVIGLAFMPFFQFLIKDPPQIRENLYYIYLLFLFNTASSYFFVYKRSLILADQKEYIVSIVEIIYTIVLNVSQIIILIVTRNFFLYLAVQILANILQNITIAKVCDFQYKFIKNAKDKLPQEDKQKIFKDVKALFLYRIGGIVQDSTDNLILSKFVGIIWVGLYSNYYLIIHSIHSLIILFISGTKASIGNLNTTDDAEKKSLIFDSTMFIAFWLFGLASICIYVLIDNFISFWISPDYVLPKNVLIILVVNFYLAGLSRTFLIFRDTFGIFIQGRYCPVISAIVNISASIFLVQRFGAFGIFLGTAISYMAVNVWMEPYFLFKYGLKKKVFPFYVRYIQYAIAVILSVILAARICAFIQLNSIVFKLLVHLAVSFIVGNIVFMIAFSRKEEFKYLLSIVKGIRKIVN